MVLSGQAIETRTKCCQVPLLNRLGGIDTEVVVNRLRLVGFQPKTRVISVRPGQIVLGGQHTIHRPANVFTAHSVFPLPPWPARYNLLAVAASMSEGSIGVSLVGNWS